MPLRPCLDCNRLSTTRRCPEHTRAYNNNTLRDKRTRRPRTAAEDRRRAQVVRAWRHTYGDWCPGYNKPPHPSRDLTADHPDEVAHGGAEDQPLTVLCRSCNSIKSHSVTGRGA